MVSDPSKPEPINSGSISSGSIRSGKGSQVSWFNWFCNTPERAIDQAYQAALAIKKLEDGFFEGKIISTQPNYSNSNNSYFRIQLSKSLAQIRRRLAEYKLSARLPFCSQPAIAPQQPLENNLDQSPNQNTGQNPSQNSEAAPLILQKLAFIDFILERYQSNKKSPLSSNQNYNQRLDLTELERSLNVGKVSNYSFFGKEEEIEKTDPKKERIIIPVEKSILPGSLFRTLKRIQNSFRDQNFRDYEQDVVTELRMSQKRVRVAIQFFATILIVFLVAQQGSKYLFFSPLVDYINRNRQLEVSLAPRLEELETELVEKYRNLKVKLELESLVTSLKVKPPETPDKNDQKEEDPNQNQATSANVRLFSPVFDYNELGEQFKEEAVKLVQEINYKELEGIKNALADVLAGFAGYAAIIVNRRQLFVIKDFMDETLYSLNDSAKALILIISTDIIVGFHSSEGWDALLTGIASHYGQPENRFFTRTFIAIVPVFLDGIFKFWIFQYLRQRSPSTATIFEQMNR